jgi:hypothetical protein
MTTGSHRQTCRLETEWGAGTVYDYQDLIFRRDGTGDWIRNDRKGPWHETPFRWTKTATTVTVTTDEGQRTVGFTLGRNRHGCVLRFETPPFEFAHDEFYGE